MKFAYCLHSQGTWGVSFAIDLELFRRIGEASWWITIIRSDIQLIFGVVAAVSWSPTFSLFGFLLKFRNLLKQFMSSEQVNFFYSERTTSSRLIWFWDKKSVKCIFQNSKSRMDNIRSRFEVLCGIFMDVITFVSWFSYYGSHSIAGRSTGMSKQI